MKVAMNSLDSYRSKIDSIDREIVELLNERMQLADKIGQLKKQASADILDNDREKHVLSRVSSLARFDPLKERIEKMYRLVFEASRGMQT